MVRSATSKPCARSLVTHLVQLQTNHEGFMRISRILSTAVAVCAAASSLTAQNPRVMRIEPGQTLVPGGGFGMLGMDMPRAVIGVGTTSGTTSRDTLGVL